MTVFPPVLSRGSRRAAAHTRGASSRLESKEETSHAPTADIPRDPLPHRGAGRRLVQHGPAHRVFASARSGSDANSCDSVLTPCQTLQGAVNQVAAGGEVIVLDSGGYGRVSIGKAVKIEASAGIVAFVHPSNTSFPAVSIFAGAGESVVLRGLVLSVGESDGIEVGSVGELRVENCLIDGFARGIDVLSPGQLVVADTVISNSGADGISLSPNSGTLIAAIARTRLDRNETGLGVGGLGAVTVKASIKDSFAVGQTNVGFARTRPPGASRS